MVRRISREGGNVAEKYQGKMEREAEVKEEEEEDVSHRYEV